MIESSAKELRYIRITLVILTLILAFTSGSRTVRVENSSSSQQFFPEFSYSNMIDLGDGNFGVISGDSKTAVMNL